MEIIRDRSRLGEKEENVENNKFRNNSPIPSGQGAGYALERGKTLIAITGWYYLVLSGFLQTEPMKRSGKSRWPSIMISHNQAYRWRSLYISICLKGPIGFHINSNSGNGQNL